MSLNKESREEVLARLLAGSLALLTRVVGDEEKNLPCQLADTADAGALAGEIAAYIDDCREFMVSLVQTQWAPGEAPPGIAEIQAELKEVEKEERKATRNKRKAAARKGGRRAN